MLKKTKLYIQQGYRGYGNQIFPVGIPTKILWEWDGNGDRNSTPKATLIYSETSL